MAKDPVCGMEVEQGALKETYRNQTYYFCGERCLDSFKANPKQFIER